MGSVFSRIYIIPYIIEGRSFPRKREVFSITKDPENAASPITVLLTRLARALLDPGHGVTTTTKIYLWFRVKTSHSLDYSERKTF